MISRTYRPRRNPVRFRARDYGFCRDLHVGVRFLMLSAKRMSYVVRGVHIVGTSWTDAAQTHASPHTMNAVHHQLGLMLVNSSALSAGIDDVEGWLGRW